jgi:hypothetical protein
MSEPNYDEIRSRIQNRFNKRKELLMHLVAYIGVNLAMWFFWFIGGIDILSRDIAGIPLPIVVTVGWGVGFLIHFLDYYYEAGGGAERRERAIQQAIEREMALRRGDFEKPKRDPHMHLTEDGELEEVSSEDDSAYQAQRGRR